MTLKMIEKKEYQYFLRMQGVAAHLQTTPCVYGRAFFVLWRVMLAVAGL